MAKFWNIPKSYLLQEYVNLNKSQKQIARELGCTHKVISRHLLLYNIPLNKALDCKKQNLTNLQFNKITFISYSHRTNSGTYWKCKCDCGNIIITRAASVKKGLTKCCGKCKIGALRLNWKGIGQLSGNHWYNIKAHAKSRNIPVILSQNDAWNIFVKQNYQCALTGIQLIFSREGTTASLDRINNEKIYSLDKVWWVHKDINRMKQDYSLKEYLNLCKLVTNNTNIPNLSFTINKNNIDNKTYNKIKHYSNKKWRFNLSLQFLKNLYKKQKGKCNLTGLPINFKNKKRTASLDRIDSLKEYAEDNVQWVHRDINYIKQHFTQIYFIKMCNLVYNHTKANKFLIQPHL